VFGVVVVVVAVDLVEDQFRSPALFLVGRAVAPVAEGPAAKITSKRPLTRMGTEM
jgi:hypothetical protein